MSRFHTFVLGAVLTLSPALMLAQNNRQAPAPRQNNAVTSGEPTTDQDNMQPATQSPATAAPIGGDYSHATTGSADRPIPDTAAPIGGDYSHATTGSADRSMPNTASGWLGLLLGGSLLGTAGVGMRRLMARG